MSSYESDTHAWAFETAARIRAGDRDLDWNHIAEEIESLGRSERDKLRSYLAVVLLHLLKLRYQPEKQTRSWRLSIASSRAEIAEHIADNPSLKASAGDLLERAWRRARFAAADETGIDLAVFPEACPWTWEQVVDPGWLPDSSAHPEQR